MLAAYWIQFMTHDWFSHLEEGHNAPQYMNVGCATKQVNNVETPLTPRRVKQLGCRPDDGSTRPTSRTTPRRALSSQRRRPVSARAPKTFHNNNTAWWDASQITATTRPRACA